MAGQNDGPRTSAPGRQGGSGGSAPSASSSSAPMTFSQRIPRKKSSSSSSSSASANANTKTSTPSTSSAAAAVAVSRHVPAAAASAKPPAKPAPAVNARNATSASAASGNNNKPPKASGAAAASAPAPPARKIMVRRPPLNAYLKVAIIRKDDDVVVCEDPEHPGKTKEIVVMKQLMDTKSQATAAATDDADDAENDKDKKQRSGDNKKSSSNKSNANKDKEAISANKKEVPVPTVTTVKRYDTDVPPNHDIPPSYVRNVCPTYREVMDDAIDYNIDAEDERWWRNNSDFGPLSEARIVFGGDEATTSASNNAAATTTSRPDDPGKNALADDEKIINAFETTGKQLLPASDKEGTKSSKDKAAKDKNRNKKGKFVKKGSSKKGLIDEVKEDVMEIDDMTETNSICDVQRTTTEPSHHNYTIDQVLLLNPSYLHSRHSTNYLLRKYNPKLPLRMFERMMDLLEKATGFEFAVSNKQAREVLADKMPELEEVFGPMSPRERRMEEEYEERHLRRWLKQPGDGAECTVTLSSSLHASSNNELPLPSLAPPITLPAVITQVHQYWMAKRSKLKKPLLRRYWPPTAATDTNPHQVFRQRDKEKRRLRKKKQNDAEAYKKMKQLKLDFERVGTLCELIARRERVNETLVELTNDYFEERLYGFVDTSGAPRQSSALTKQTIESELNDMPKCFDDGPIIRAKGGKKRKRSSHAGWNAGDSRSRDPSPVPTRPTLALSGHDALHPPKNAHQGIMAHPLPHGMMKPPPLAPMPPPRNLVVAGHDGGLPAPNFLQPLPSRESHTVTTWENAVPSMPSYINGKSTQSDKLFRHRPRLGRGGRIVVDRVPCPSSISRSGVVPSSPPTVITYGSPMPRSGYDISALGADGPNYSINSSPDKYGPNRSPLKNRGGQAVALAEGTGTDAKSAPKAPPARSLVDLLPKPLGNPMLISRKIEEICALGLMEDSSNQSAETAPAVSLKSGMGLNVPAALGEEMDEVLVPIEDWMEAPEGLKVYGSEKFVIGPL